MAEKLTPQQKMAVENRGGKLLVSAAAGSGKTKVLVDRLLKYIRDPYDPANIDDFLIITYTKAAAAELRSKIAAKLSEHIAADPGNRHLQRQLQRLYLTKISTVHSFCSDILREFAYRLDISGDFRVADENEIIQLRSRAMEQVLENAYAAIGTDADTFTMDSLSEQTIKVAAKYLTDLEEDSATYAVRIINIPAEEADTTVYARAYYVYEDAEGNQVVVYDEIYSATYNG